MIDGKNAARAAPMLALAARSECSAARMSGRRSSSSDVQPGRHAVQRVTRPSEPSGRRAGVERAAHQQLQRVRGPRDLAFVPRRVGACGFDERAHLAHGPGPRRRPVRCAWPRAGTRPRAWRAWPWPGAAARGRPRASATRWRPRRRAPAGRCAGSPPRRSSARGRPRSRLSTRPNRSISNWVMPTLGRVGARRSRLSPPERTSVAVAPTDGKRSARWIGAGPARARR